MNRTTVVIIPLCLALALPLSVHATAPRYAAADGPHMVGVTTIHTATKPVPWPITCGDFTTDATFRAVATSFDDIDGHGALIRETRHVTFTGTIYNHKTGKSTPYHGTFIRLEDLQTKTLTIAGLNVEVNAPDGRVLLLESGVKVVTDDAKNTVLYAKGTFDLTRHHSNALCAALR